MSLPPLPVPIMPLSIVVPCHNEAEALPELIRRVDAACRDVVGERYELILVNDGSTDGTWPSIQALAQERRQVVGVDLARRHGQQLALSAGLSLCRGSRVLILDADLQDPPELLAEMMKRMNAGADVVYGQRTSRAGESWFKRFSAKCFYRLMACLGEVTLPPDSGDFRLISRRILEILHNMPERHRYLRGMVAWVGLRQEAIPYARRRRVAGKTKYPLRRMVNFALDAITGFSIFPLRLSFYIALLFAALAFLLLLYVLVSWLFLGTVRGWTSMTSIFLLFSGLQFFCIGIIGEYVGRIYMENKRRPMFIVREVTGQKVY